MNDFKMYCGKYTIAGPQTLVAVFVLGLLAVIPACGRGQKPIAPAGGKVMYKGKPLPFGSVIFVPKGGGPMARGVIQSDGTFKMTTDGKDGAVVSHHAVRITCYDKNSKAAGAAISPDDKATVLGRSLIPMKYTRSQTSGLEVEVKDGENEPFMFDLQ